MSATEPKALMDPPPGGITTAATALRREPQRRTPRTARRADASRTVPGDRQSRDSKDVRLNVLYVAEAFGGGMFEITRMMAEGLARNDHRVGIAYGLRPETPANFRETVMPDVELIPVPWTARTVFAQIRALQTLRRVCREWEPDVVHLMSSFAGIHGALAARDVPTVYTPQAYAFTRVSEPIAKRWLFLLLENFVARHVDVIGACSLSEGEQARSLPGAVSVVVVPNGIEELSGRIDAPPNAGGREPTVVAVGRPQPQRRPEACARILASISDHAHVRWLGGGGNGNNGNPGERALRDAGIPMTGWMPRKEILSALAASTVYLHWTAWDGLPLSVLEAMAMDVVVVASDIGPNREVLGPRQVCRTEEEAIELLKHLLANPQLREEFLANQRERRRWHGADEMVGNWIEVYRSLNSGKRRAVK